MTRGTGQSHHIPGATARADRVRLPLDFDPVLLERDLARLGAQDWTAHYVPDHYDGEWSVLPLRAPVGAVHPVLRIATNPGCVAWEDTALLAACPYLQTVLRRFRSPLQAARLMRLAPGSSIKPHRDPDLAAEIGMARLHVPIRTNPQVDFRLNGIRVDMTPGSTWYLRLADTHSVRNAGRCDRVHLVIDLVVDAWLAHMLDAATAPPPVPIA